MIIKKILSESVSLKIQIPEEKPFLTLNLSQVDTLNVDNIIRAIKEQNPWFFDVSHVPKECAICLSERPEEDILVFSTDDDENSYVLDPRYDEVCLEQWVQFTGSPAKHPTMGGDIAAVLVLSKKVLRHNHLSNNMIDIESGQTLEGQVGQVDWVINLKIPIVSSLALLALGMHIGANNIFSFKDYQEPGFLGAAILAGIQSPIKTLVFEWPVHGDGQEQSVLCQQLLYSAALLLSMGSSALQQGQAVEDFSGGEEWAAFSRLAFSSLTHALLGYYSTQSYDPNAGDKFRSELPFCFFEAIQIAIAGAILRSCEDVCDNESKAIHVFFSELAPIIFCFFCCCVRGGDNRR